MSDHSGLISIATIAHNAKEVSDVCETVDDTATLPQESKELLDAALKDPSAWWSLEIGWRIAMWVLLFYALAGGWVPGLALVGFGALFLYSAGRIAQHVYFSGPYVLRELIGKHDVRSMSESEFHELKKEDKCNHYICTTGKNPKVYFDGKEVPELSKALRSSEKQTFTLDEIKPLHTPSFFRWKNVKLALNILLELAFLIAAGLLFVGEGGAMILLPFLGAGTLATVTAALVPALPYLILIGAIFIAVGTVLSFTIGTVFLVNRYKSEIKEFFRGAFDEVSDIVASVRSTVSSVCNFVYKHNKPIQTFITKVCSNFILTASKLIFGFLIMKPKANRTAILTSNKNEETKKIVIKPSSDPINISKKKNKKNKKDEDEGEGEAFAFKFEEKKKPLPLKSTYEAYNKNSVFSKSVPLPTQDNNQENHLHFSHS